MKKKYLVVGAGFSGSVIARELANSGDCSVLVMDERTHVAGNCHTLRDDATGVMVHQYGPHIFHTDNKKIWDYVNQFGHFVNFINRVKASTSCGIFSLPINLHTINQFFGKRFSPNEAREFIQALGDSSIETPQNFEEQALKMVGEDLYRAFLAGYTKKQWGCDARKLPASILKRLPVRFNYDDNYYNSRYQGIPEEGYTKIVEKILEHPLIDINLGSPFCLGMESNYDHVFFTGPIDAFFEYSEGRLGYRTVYWDRVDATGDYQGNAVINYPDLDVSYTRIHEHKHFAPWEEHDKTVAFIEYSKETHSGDIPYYPKRLIADNEMFGRYKNKAVELANVSFVGRLATYRYLDMDRVIEEALVFSEKFIFARKEGEELPVFSGHQ